MTSTGTTETSAAQDVRMTSPRRRRRGGTVGDMFRTLAIFILIIVGIVAFLPQGTKKGGPEVIVSYSQPLTEIRNEAPFHIYAPASLPAGWNANHVSIVVPQPGKPVATFDLGIYIAKGNNYVAVEQSNAAGWVATQLGKTAVLTGTVTIDAVVYQTYRDNAGHPALVRVLPSSVLVLDGVASSSTLDQLAATLS